MNTAAIITCGVAMAMKETKTLVNCTCFKYEISIARFASMLAMNRGSHVMNFATRMPEKNSLVAFTRASVAFISFCRAAICHFMIHAFTGSVNSSANSATREHQPTKRLRKIMEMRNTMGLLQMYMQY
ncbi:hypothetical protein ABL78_8289 [Leptomonas seymouri]|uniref:Uncharacterized protein n=1 Tax=Leptomonas seymouri TaxID=5684 RepID=A0A0N0P296_LEPSE|nr:hypothetical protein ABL78_8289 [Leptomonas seymouri]|eukprot:KPI82696.1 hypothetical protein ABL78_8289 [Leptomonas seymouri]